MDHSKLRISEIGWDFEVLVLGLPPGEMPEPAGPHFKPPKRLSEERSIQQQIQQNWKRLDRAISAGNRNEHNPYQPTNGKIAEVWKYARRNLNKKWGKEDYYSLLLYLSVGRNSLDWHYGVDAFFWWNGVYVTIDVSTHRKKKVKANFSLTSKQLDQKSLSQFGAAVAGLLMEKKRAQVRSAR